MVGVQRSQSTHSTSSSITIANANQPTRDARGYKIHDASYSEVTLSPAPVDGQSPADASADGDGPPLEEVDDKQSFIDRFTRKGKPKVGVAESCKAIARSSYLNILLAVIPFSWASNFLHWKPIVTFSLSFIAILPLAKLFEFGAVQMNYYLGKDFGDLLNVTLHNAVEATLAIILLMHCELALLKATIIGVVVLHLLLVPGFAFIVGGTKVVNQDLHPHITELNHSLLAVGVLSLVMPVAFYSALDDIEVDDSLRNNFLKLSRGIAFCLLFIYVCSRIYLHNPPPDETGNSRLPEAPKELKKYMKHYDEGDPKVNQYVCIAMLLVCIGLMATTAEWLVHALEEVKSNIHVELGFFGLVILPVVSWIPNGAIAVAYFVRKSIRVWLGLAAPKPLTTLAKGKAIDLSIQFTLFWMPFLVLLGWCVGKPMTLLFDLFEVSILVTSCFIVNYVTADAKTNWAEGATMVAFYVMIVVCAWYYPGSRDSEILSACDSVAESLQKLATPAR